MHMSDRVSKSEEPEEANAVGEIEALLRGLDAATVAQLTALWSGRLHSRDLGSQDG